MESVVKESFLKHHKTQVIYNGVDLAVFKPRDSDKLRIKYNPGNKKVILGVAAVWSELKGLKAFIELANYLDNQTVIILIGLTKKQIRSLPKNIIGIGTTENVDELAEFYSLAEVFVNPSIAESFGLVTAEAMACGTPVAAYNVTATPELVKEGTGFVVEKNNIAMLHSSIMKILNAGKAEYADNCRKTAETFFNKNAQYKKYIELYNSLSV
jgi:glycosyltransferase involved in cell wall biosynthesis